MLAGPMDGGVEEVPDPVAGPGEAVVEVARVGLCGTDVEFWTGHMPYLDTGQATYPMRLGHEWTGTVVSVGGGVDPHLVGARVVGNPMVGCGSCPLCRRGRPHVCPTRDEVGVRDGRDGALAEQVCVAADSLHVLPASMDVTLGALVEPAGNALRAARSSGTGPGDRVLVLGPGTIGLLVAMFLRAAGVDVHLLGRTASSMAFARELGFSKVWTESDLPDVAFDAVVDAANAAHLPALAAEVVSPGGRVVLMGLSSEPSLVDTRRLALRDVTAVGLLSASPAFSDAVAALGEGRIDPRPLVAATIGLDEVGQALADATVRTAVAAPKLHVDPHILHCPKPIEVTT